MPGSPPTPFALAIIPARLGSTRFPRKVLADRTGWPLIRHVWSRAGLAPCVSRVIIATDAMEVRDAVLAFGGECVMTREDHPNGSSRLAEVCDTLGLPGDAVIVNVQGDEPEIEPDAIDAAAQALVDSGADAATIASPFLPGEDPDNPNIVKVVTTRAGMALYFSRSRIPHARSGGTPADPRRHVGLYAYRAATLRRYVSLAPTPLELSESLEQLRLLEHGLRIAVAERTVRATGIDTPEQYEAFVLRHARTKPVGR